VKRCSLVLVALCVAGLSHAQLVQNALTRELRRIFPELGQGYLDLNRNGRRDQADDLDERVPESSIKDSEIQGQEILDFILENFRYLDTGKLVQVQKLLAGVDGSIPELVALSYRIRIDEAVRIKRELDGQGLYLTPSALREALERISGHIATMTVAYKKEGQSYESDFGRARSEFFQMIEEGYPIPPDLESRERDVLTLVLVNELIKGGQSSRLQAAVRTLGELRSEDAVPYLIAGLDDPNLSRDSIQALGMIGGEEAGPRLLKELDRAEDPETRIEIIRALGHAGGEESLVRLKGILAEPEDAQVEEAALGAVVTMTENGVKDPTLQVLFSSYLEHEAPEMRTLAIQGLSFHAHRATGNRLVELLGNEKELEVRQEIVLGLDRIKHTGTGQALIGLLRDQSTPDELRETVLTTLGHGHGGTQALPFITADLGSSNPEVSAAATEALISQYQTSPDAVVGTLSRALLRDADRSTMIRGTAILARLADNGSLNTLVALLGSPYPEVKRNAAWGIYRIGSDANPRAADELNKLVNNETEAMGVRINAVRALGAIRSTNPRVDVGETLVKVAKLRGERYYMLRYFAVEALADLGDSSERALKTLMAVSVRERDPVLKRQATAALKRLAVDSAGVEETLTRLYRGTEDPGIQTLAVEALGDIGSDMTAPLAGELLSSGGENSRRVLHALAQVGGPAEIEVMLDAAAQPELTDYVELVLEDLDGEVLARVIDERLRTESNQTVIAVMESLQTTMAESY
jgi:HEAT repeat protein